MPDPAALPLSYNRAAQFSRHVNAHPCQPALGPQYGILGLQVLFALDAKVDSVVTMATGETKESATEVWWESLSQRPPFKYAVTAYQQAHDAVVATPIYTKCAPVLLL